MPRQPLVSLSPLEGIEALDNLLTLALADGVIDLDEQRQLRRVVKSLRKRMERLHDSLTFADRAMHGDGIDSPWFDRTWKEDRKNRPALRVVWTGDDEPSPDGPAAKKVA